MPNIVKHSYIKGPRTTARAIAHVNYIQYRPGEDRDKDIDRGERGVDEDYKERQRDPGRPLRVAGDEHEEHPGKASHDFKAALEDSRERGRFVHKFILSPSERDVDMDAYTQDVMDSIGRAKGQDLRYAWVVHDNTDNRHAHVVVLGKDEEGHEVKFNRHDHTCMRAYGDRYLEREHGIEMQYSRDMEMHARTHGHNLYVSDREENIAFFERPIGGSSFQLDEDFRHLMDMNKNWAEALDGPSREGGLHFGNTWMNDRGRLSELHDLFQNTQDRDLWTDVKEYAGDDNLKDYADGQLSLLDGQRQRTLEELQIKTGLPPEKFDDFIAGIQQQFAKENLEIDQALFPEKYEPQPYEHKDINTEKIAQKDLIHLSTGDVISKYDSAEYLNDVRVSLKQAGPEDRLATDDYAKLCRWIGVKEQRGEDFYGQPPLKDERQPAYDRSLDLNAIPDSRSIESISMDTALDTKRLGDLFRPTLDQPARQESGHQHDYGIGKLELPQDLQLVAARQEPLETRAATEIEGSIQRQEPYQTNYDIEFRHDPIESSRGFEDFYPNRQPEIERSGHAEIQQDHSAVESFHRFQDDSASRSTEQAGIEQRSDSASTDRGSDSTPTPERSTDDTPRKNDDERTRGDR